ncbi:MAG: 4Fe-4S binding protein [Nitrososphaerota archaeon]
MYPYCASEIKEDKVVTRMKTLDIDITLTLDLKKCVGCGTCAVVCPKEAIRRGPVGAVEKGEAKLPPVLVDAKKCSFCGVCSYMCPFEALELRINGEPRLILVEEGALPPLKYDEFVTLKGNRTAKKYAEGELIVHWELCPAGCSTCADICPNEAIKIPKPEKPWEKGPRVQVEQEKCLLCGACVYACPAPGALELKRTKIKYDEKAEYTSLWNRIVEKLTTKIVS